MSQFKKQKLNPYDNSNFDDENNNNCYFQRIKSQCSGNNRNDLIQLYKLLGTFSIPYSATVSLTLTDAIPTLTSAAILGFGSASIYSTTADATPVLSDNVTGFLLNSIQVPSAIDDIPFMGSIYVVPSDSYLSDFKANVTTSILTSTSTSTNTNNAYKIRFAIYAAYPTFPIDSSAPFVANFKNIFYEDISPPAANNSYNLPSLSTISSGSNIPGQLKFPRGTLLIVTVSNGFVTPVTAGTTVSFTGQVSATLVLSKNLLNYSV